jgi:hypothetical protein
MAITTLQNESEILATRVPRRVVAEIQLIAEREDENRSTIVRRLLRRALDQERRQRDHAAAVARR